MDLHYLEIFNMVAKKESYKNASEILHISQPALSIQIKKLEEQLGLKLFNRVGNRIQLSENGILLQEYTERIFDIVDELEHNLSNTKNFIGGTLNIGGSNTPGTYLLPEIIGEFKKQYPGIKVNLHIGNTSEISHLISNGTLDIAINGGNGVYGNSIYVEEIMRDKLVVVASPKNPYCENEKITVDDLRELSFVVHKTDSQLYTYYRKFIDDLKIQENVSMYLGNIDAIKRAVESDLGITLIPTASIRFELQYGILKVLDIIENTLEYPYSLIYNQNKALSATSRKFIEFIHQESKKILL